MSYFCNPKTGDSLAQQVEHNTFNVGVLGSSPRRITEKPCRNAGLFCFMAVLQSFLLLSCQDVINNLSLYELLVFIL